MYGQGSWYIQWDNETDYTETTNDYVFWNPSGGDYGFNETLSLLDIK